MSKSRRRVIVIVRVVVSEMDVRVVVSMVEVVVSVRLRAHVRRRQVDPGR